jgi:hypothetical protein
MREEVAAKVNSRYSRAEIPPCYPQSSPPPPGLRPPWRAASAATSARCLRTRRSPSHGTIGALGVTRSSSSASTTAPSLCACRCGINPRAARAPSTPGTQHAATGRTSGELKVRGAWGCLDTGRASFCGKRATRRFKPRPRRTWRCGRCWICTRRCTRSSFACPSSRCVGTRSMLSEAAHCAQPLAWRIAAGSPLLHPYYNPSPVPLPR